MKIGIHGINGKMGRAIAHELVHYEDCQLGAASVRSGHAWADKALGEVSDLPQKTLKPTANIEYFVSQSDVVVDFTRPEAALALLPICQKLNKPLLIGTTGFSAEGRKWIEQAAQSIPIILAANTSLGVNVLLEIVQQVAKVLPKEIWDVDIFEAHHRDKMDAPSGTALRLGETIAKAQESVFNERKLYPYTQKRKPESIGFSVVRGGDIVGEHTVYFAKQAERLEFTHRATDRRIFAEGAIKAARWLKGRSSGLYTMADVLGFGASSEL